MIELDQKKLDLFLDFEVRLEKLAISIEGED